MIEQEFRLPLMANAMVLIMGVWVYLST